MHRLASVRFDRALVEQERAEAARALLARGCEITAWKSVAPFPLTFAQAILRAGADPRAAERETGARICEPPAVVLAIAPQRPKTIPALAEALGGKGAPAGVTACAASGAALLLELDAGVTPLDFVVKLIDVELRYAPGRSIVALFDLPDDVLAAFAAATLECPDLDASRLIETYTEPMLRAAP